MNINLPGKNAGSFDFSKDITRKYRKEGKVIEIPVEEGRIAEVEKDRS